MDNNIISVEPIEKFFSITWMFGLRCNYDCMYCPPRLHDKTSQHHDLPKLQEAWIKIYDQTVYKNLAYKISFTGGEVTANKHFFNFVCWLKEKYNVTNMLFTTNGSAGIKYYEKIAKYVSSITFSTHTEFMDEKLFFQKAKLLNKLMIRPKKSFHVNIMNEYWARERIQLYKDFCLKNKISFSINEIDYSLKTRTKIYKNGKTNF